MAQLKTVCFTSRVWWFTTVRFIPFPTHVTSVQGLCKSSSLVPRISISSIYHPWHPGPLHIIILGTQNLYIYYLPSLVSRAFTYHHPWYPESLNLTFTIPGIQGLYTSSCLVPRISLSNIYHPWHPGPLHINILGTRMVGMIKIR